MKYRPMFIFWIVLIGVTLQSAEPSSSSEVGKAEGKLIVNNETSQLKFAYAIAQSGFFDKTKEDILVIVTNVPLSDLAVEDWGERQQMEREGILHCVEMTINAEGKPVSVKVRHKAFQTSPGGLSTDDIFEPTIFDEQTIEGKMFCKKPREFFGTTFQYNVTFMATIHRKKKSPPPTEADKAIAAKSPQAAVYRAFEKAIQAGDIEALKTLVSRELVKELSGPDGKDMIEFMQLFLPTKVEFLRVTVEGDSAVLRARGEADGEETEGTIELVLEGGKWKIVQSEW